MAGFDDGANVLKPFCDCNLTFTLAKLLVKVPATATLTFLNLGHYLPWPLAALTKKAEVIKSCHFRSILQGKP